MLYGIIFYRVFYYKATILYGIITMKNKFKRHTTYEEMGENSQKCSIKTRKV